MILSQSHRRRLMTPNTDPQLPLGTRKHSMKLAYHGGEIYFLHLDTFEKREDLVLARIMEAVATVLADTRKVFRKAAIVDTE